MRRSDRRSAPQRLAELTELLLSDRSLEDLLEAVVRVVGAMSGVAGAAVMLPGEEGPRVVAASGEPFSQDDLQGIAGAPAPVSLATTAAGSRPVRVLALAPSGRPVGLLVVRGLPPDRDDRDLLTAFSHAAALAIERTQLRAEAVEAEVLRGTDRVRQALTEAVSHDLRAPLATIRAASEALQRPMATLSGPERSELWKLLDFNTARLDRLVGGLLGVARYQSGALALMRGPHQLPELVRRAVAVLEGALAERRIDIRVAPGTGPVDVDPLLVEQVLVNLIENANHYGPPGTPIRIEAGPDGAWAVVSVTDQGPGVAPAHRSTVFDGFVRHGPRGRAGLGLSIARNFVNAHGGEIWVEDGARFSFTVPLAAEGRRDELTASIRYAEWPDRLADSGDDRSLHDRHRPGHLVGHPRPGVGVHAPP